MKLKVGIFFGGPSRLREQSFTGALDIYRHLDTQLFEPILILVDIHGQLVHVREKNLTKQRLQHFFQPPKPDEEYDFLVYQESLTPAMQMQQRAEIGKTLDNKQLSQLINFAFVGLEGAADPYPYQFK